MDGPCFLKSIHLQNLLSFGPKSEAIELLPLNVLIGPNGSGKSNLIEAVGLLQSVPRTLASPVRDGGGIRDWLWKGERNPTATIDAVVHYPHGKMPLRHVLSFTEVSQRFHLTDERIENEQPYHGKTQPYFYFRYENNRPMLNVGGTRRLLRREDVDPDKSILAQRKDPEQYPEITYLGEQYERIRIFREWSFGRYTVPRQPQKADQRNDYLSEDYANLGLILNRLSREPNGKRRYLEQLKKLYAGIEDFHLNIEGGTVQIFLLEEDGRSIPATRLSDGTLRYLCLLAILMHPSPPPLVCIEEPELGMHPDILRTIADLLVEASTRMQLIVTTHSDVIVSALTETPEAILVCMRGLDGTQFRRLDPEQLQKWLGQYSLGQLWSMGELGGNRW